MSDSEAKPIYSTMPTKKIETRPVSGATQISPTYMRATDAQRPTTSRNSDEKEKSLESRCESRNASKTAKPLDPTELKREVKDARPPKATLNGPADLHDSERRSLDGEEKGDVWSNQPETKLNSKKPEANEEVMQYIKGLRNIEYNIKKYTCFYCNVSNRHLVL